MAHGSKAFRRAKAAVRDFALGLAVFWGVTFAVCASHGPAQALPLPKAAAFETGAAQLLNVEKASYYTTVAHGALRELNPAQVTAKPTMAMLGFVFALLTMMNLAFLRHVRRAYLSKPVRRTKTG
jgi:hypothetical protein